MTVSSKLLWTQTWSLCLSTDKILTFPLATKITFGDLWIFLYSEYIDSSEMDLLKDLGSRNLVILIVVYLSSGQILLDIYYYLHTFLRAVGHFTMKSQQKLKVKITTFENSTWSFDPSHHTGGGKKLCTWRVVFPATDFRCPMVWEKSLDDMTS